MSEPVEPYEPEFIAHPVAAAVVLIGEVDPTPVELAPLTFEYPFPDLNYER